MLADGHALGRLVQRDRPDLKVGLRASMPVDPEAPTPQRPQPSRQFLERERLDEVVVRAGIQSRYPVAHRVACGQHQDLHIRPHRPDAARDLQAADIGKADIQDDALDAGSVLGDLQPRPPVRGQYDVPVILQEPLEQPGEPRIILDDEQMHGRQPSGPI